MAAIRPVILVFQEFANPTVVPTEPDLQCLIVGPAYQILDYDEDKDDIGLAVDYGVLEDDVEEDTPVGDAVISAAAPARTAGALVDNTSVKVYFDEARVIIAEGEKMTTSAATPGTVVTLEDTPTAFNVTGEDKVLPGDRLIVSDGTANLVRTILSVINATTLKLTADIPGAGFAPGANQAWRIERKLNDQQLNEGDFDVDENTIIIHGDVALNVTGQGLKLVSYAKVYVAYTALRQDLQEVDSVGTVNDIESKIGRIDARNPLAANCFVALQNTGSKIHFYGVESNDVVGHARCRDAISANRDIYAIVPLVVDTAILGMWKLSCEDLADRDESKGRPQKFRVVIGSGALPDTEEKVEPQATGLPVVLTGSTPAGVYRLTIPGAGLVNLGVVPGDKLTIAADTGGVEVNGAYVVSHVVSDTILEIDGVFPSAKTLNVTATFKITDITEATERRAASPASGAVTAAGSALFLTLKDDSGTFVASGVTPGDLVEMPLDPETEDFSEVSSWVIDEVLSDNRLRLMGTDRNTSTVENELPHGVKRTGGALVPTTAILNYRIVRALSKDGQVTNLVALAQSFHSRRTVLVWPDRVDAAGIVGGTDLPGYYLASAVGGMTAGLPPHQGFTNLGIAGITRIYNSNTYFTDEQLTDLMQGGWFIFAQQTPDSLPFSIHQLTTDPSTLETGEYSVVKNFDYVALYFVDILEEFLGSWNVTEEMMGFIRNAMDTGITTLRLRTFAKIGAPLISGRIIELGQSSISEDRVVAKLAIGLPKPLNVIELRLVA